MEQLKDNSKEDLTLDQLRQVDELMSNLDTLDHDTTVTLAPLHPIKPAFREVVVHYLEGLSLRKEEDTASQFDPPNNNEHLKALCAAVPVPCREVDVKTVLVQLETVPDVRFFGRSKYSVDEYFRGQFNVATALKSAPDMMRAIKEKHMERHVQVAMKKPCKHDGDCRYQIIPQFRRLQHAVARMLDPGSFPCAVISPLPAQCHSATALSIAILDEIMEEFQLERIGIRVKWVQRGTFDPAGNNLRGGWVMADMAVEEWDLVKRIFFSRHDPDETPEPTRITAREWLTLHGVQYGEVLNPDGRPAGDEKLYRVAYFDCNTDHSRQKKNASVTAGTSSLDLGVIDLSAMPCCTPIFTLYFPVMRRPDPISHENIEKCYIKSSRLTKSMGRALNMDALRHPPYINTRSHMLFLSYATATQAKLNQASKDWETARSAAQQYREHNAVSLFSGKPDVLKAQPAVAATHQHYDEARKKIDDVETRIGNLEDYLLDLNWEYTPRGSGGTPGTGKEEWRARLNGMRANTDEILKQMISVAPKGREDYVILQQIEERQATRRIARELAITEDVQPAAPSPPPTPRRSTRVRRPSVRFSP